MKKYIVPQNRKIQQRGLLAFKGEIQLIEYDFATWETENGTVTSVTWTIKNGQAGITNESLASSKASAHISTTEYGRSLIEVKATTDTGLTLVTNINVLSKDPQIQSNVHDYYGWYH